MECNDCGKKIQGDDIEWCVWCDNVAICKDCADLREGCCDSCYDNGYEPQED
jgi:hypothetical protein